MPPIYTNISSNSWDLSFNYIFLIFDVKYYVIFTVPENFIFLKGFVTRASLDFDWFYFFWHFFWWHDAATYELFCHAIANWLLQKNVKLQNQYFIFFGPLNSRTRNFSIGNWMWKASSSKMMDMMLQFEFFWESNNTLIELAFQLFHLNI